MHTMESQTQSIKLWCKFLIVFTNNTLQKQQKTQTHLFLQWGLVSHWNKKDNTCRKETVFVTSLIWPIHKQNQRHKKRVGGGGGGGKKGGRVRGRVVLENTKYSDNMTKYIQQKFNVMIPGQADLYSWKCCIRNYTCLDTLYCEYSHCN